MFEPRPIVSAFQSPSLDIVIPALAVIFPAAIAGLPGIWPEIIESPLSVQSIGTSVASLHHDQVHASFLKRAAVTFAEMTHQSTLRTALFDDDRDGVQPPWLLQKLASTRAPPAQNTPLSTLAHDLIQFHAALRIRRAHWRHVRVLKHVTVCLCLFRACRHDINFDYETDISVMFALIG